MCAPAKIVGTFKSSCRNSARLIPPLLAAKAVFFACLQRLVGVVIKPSSCAYTYPSKNAHAVSHTWLLPRWKINVLSPIQESWKKSSTLCFREQAAASESISPTNCSTKVCVSAWVMFDRQDFAVRWALQPDDFVVPKYGQAELHVYAHISPEVIWNGRRSISLFVDLDRGTTSFGEACTQHDK